MNKTVNVDLLLVRACTTVRNTVEKISVWQEFVGRVQKEMQNVSLETGSKGISVI